MVMILSPSPAQVLFSRSRLVMNDDRAAKRPLFHITAGACRSALAANLHIHTSVMNNVNSKRRPPRNVQNPINIYLQSTRLTVTQFIRTKRMAVRAWWRHRSRVEFTLLERRCQILESTLMT